MHFSDTFYQDEVTQCVYANINACTVVANLYYIVQNT